MSHSHPHLREQPGNLVPDVRLNGGPLSIILGNCHLGWLLFKADFFELTELTLQTYSNQIPGSIRLKDLEFKLSSLGSGQVRFLRQGSH